LAGSAGGAELAGSAGGAELAGSAGGERLYREAIGGAPLNVAVGLARLGNAVEFVGSLGDDVLAGRIRAMLDAAGVSTRGCVVAGGPTTIALTTFDGTEPDFHFYGEPPSYGRLRSTDVDTAMVAGAGVLYCGSIALLCPDALAAARTAWAVPGPLRAFDPNVRPRVLTDPVAYRGIVEEFAATADLVKLSVADAAALFDLDPVAAGAATEAAEAAEAGLLAAAAEAAEAAGSHLLAAGAGAVVVTLGAGGALVVHRSDTLRIPSPPVRAIDATGAGDAAMAALLHGLLARGDVPTDAAGWAEPVTFAMRVAAMVCEAPGGATAMPTRSAVSRRFPSA
jgi:fructokinase